MRKIVAATKNTGKLAELRYIMRDWPLEVLSLQDIGLEDLEITETGTSFEENALQKARQVKAKTDYAVLSDDSGMCVDALNGEPGIYSARYGGDVPFSEKRQQLLRLMNWESDRKAHFMCAIAIIFEDGQEFTAEGRVDGQIAREERGEHGFGYDAIFQLADGRTFGEIEFEEKHNMSHRYLALKQMYEKLQDDKALRLFG
ncbi:MAG TPA: RdgB/HAM1 family non-canonical purine NTP pyrophosphatase [Tissierellia bacterium]|nr:RdgB/HAM1 family non-canonical purine NTP pyrophosphatase [Tissierellia bacterium]